MKEMPNFPPYRVTDLVELKKQGMDVTCGATFEILPVDFAHLNNPFRAHIFVCMFNGAVNNEVYSFRKCYSRGCPNNLCPHVSQAVMIANRYLQRDYHRLEQAGIAVARRLFSLEEMTVKFEDLHEDAAQATTVYDFIADAGDCPGISVEASLEWVSAVEHFAQQDSRTIFLMANFRIDCQGKITRYERCLACYPAESDHAERQRKITIANQRLKLLYEEFEQAAIQCENRYF